jgi:hypothetical protein
MRRAAVALLLVLLAAACGPSTLKQAASSASQSPRVSSSFGSPSAIPGISSPTVTPSAEPVPTEATGTRLNCPKVTVPNFAPTVPTSRSLAIVWLHGSATPVVRDLTDITHPFTAADLAYTDDPGIYRNPAVFVGGSDVSWLALAGYLYRADTATGSRELVTQCAYTVGWSADGTAAFYISGAAYRIAELHRVAGGLDTVIDPNLGQIGYCDSEWCASQWIAYSPDGRYVAVSQSPGPGLSLWTADGRRVQGSVPPSGTEPVWSGDGLYYSDAAGVEVWRGGSPTPVLPGVKWQEPHGSPGGGQIVYSLPDASGMPSVYMLDTLTGKTRRLAPNAGSPIFLTPRFVWFEGFKTCAPPLSCVYGPIPLAMGPSYIYDLQAGTATLSVIDGVSDVWPHAA